MAKATNGIGEFDQKLLDIMNGRMTDVSEIAAVWRRQMRRVLLTF